MNNSNTRSMIETALLSAITVIMVMAGTFPPLMLLLFVSAVPVAVLTARQGLKYGGAGAGLAGGLLFILLDPISALSAFSLACLGGLGLGELFRRKQSASVIVLVSSILFAIGFGVTIVGYAQLGAMDMVGTIESMYKELGSSLETMKSLPNMTAEIMANYKLILEETKRLTIMLIPSFIVLYGFFMAATNYMVARPILKRTGFDVPPIGKFRLYRLPESIVPGIFVIAVLTFVTGQLGYIDSEVIYMNMAMLFSYPFAFQGVSVFTYFAYAIKGRVAFKAAFIVAAILFGPLYVFAALGMADAVMDIRKIYEIRNAER